MKLLLVLLCLLLCGCSREAPETETTIPTIAAIPETEPASMYAPGHSLEAAHQGALRVYPLTLKDVQGIRPMGKGLLVFSGNDSTTLTMLSGADLTVTASVALDFSLDPNDPSVRITDGTLSYFDPTKHEMVVLNEDLKEVSRISVTETLSGHPILSADRNTLYYCTYNAIRAWDLETGIHRTVKELAYDDQQLTGLHLNDTVLQCRIRDGETLRTLFLDTATGQLLSQQEGDVSLTTDGDRYYAALPVSMLELLLFGETAGDPRILYPEDLATANFYLPQSHAAVTASITADERMELTCYSLDTGLCLARLSLDSLQLPRSIVTGSDGFVYILAYDLANTCDTIYRWEISQEAFALDTANETVYTEAYAAQATLDHEALAQCQAYAAELSEKYGIQILVWEDALAVQPWDYKLEAESLPRVLRQELELLDQRLSQYPQGMLEKTKANFTDLKICLVRQITGTAASGSLTTATGVQFFDGTDAYVVIAVGKYSQQALYHELFHVMETHILNESIAFDQWNDLNPTGFAYTYSNASHPESASYLSGDSRAFVDSYSMSFPKEDRARVMESAMLPGNRAMFASPIMQAKLTKLCEGIRQAYGLRKSEETFLWEQYLEVPLAYSK